MNHLTRITSWTRLIALCLLISTIQTGIARAQQEATLSLIINYIETEPIPNEVNYRVKAYVTVADSEGQPVTNLSAADFEVFEGGTPVEIEEVTIADEGMAVVLVMDTSYSMDFDNKMESAIDAATRFVSNLALEDEVAVLAFNDTVYDRESLTKDHGAVLNFISRLEAVQGGGTCLWDAAFEGVDVLLQRPPGRRALLVLTDGIDETGSTPPVEPCSLKTQNDVINHATSSGVRVPIYTIGVGERIRPVELLRLSEETAGLAHIAPTAFEIEEMFSRISSQLKNQYLITYISNSPRGEQQLLAQTNYRGQTLQDARSFLAAELPPLVQFANIREEQELMGTETLVVDAVSQAAIARVEFYADESLLIGTVTSSPFELEFDTQALEPGTHSLQAFVFDAQGRIGQSEPVSVEILAPPTATPTNTPTPTPEPTATPTSAPEEPTETPEPPPPPDDPPTSSNMTAMLCLGASLLGGLGVMAYGLVRRRSRTTVAEPGELWDTGDFSGFSEELEDETTDVSDQLQTEDVSADLPRQAIARLVVERSLDLPGGDIFPLYTGNVTIGRGTDNDFIIPDAPVSRKHALISYQDGGFWIYDQRSKYGTIVNGQRVSERGVRLANGDRIQIGTQTYVRFEALGTAVDPFAENDTTDIDDL